MRPRISRSGLKLQTIRIFKTLDAGQEMKGSSKAQLVTGLHTFHCEQQARGPYKYWGFALGSLKYVLKKM